MDEEILSKLPEWYRILAQLYVRAGDSDKHISKDGDEGAANSEKQ